MSQVLDWRKIDIQGSQSPLGFDSSESWSRYMTLDGKRAFHIGGKCDTCGFMFERLEGANRSVSVKELAAQLSRGIGELDAHLVQQLSGLLPDGPYVAALSRISPVHVTPSSDLDYFSHEQPVDFRADAFWGLPHYPKTKYYRGVSLRRDQYQQFFEFVVPMFPEGWLNQERVAFYRQLLRDGAAPTALSISLLDVRQQHDRFEKHWCLAHYLLDGHHKMYAASLEGKPLTVLSFIYVWQSMSSADEIDEMLRFW